MSRGASALILAAGLIAGCAKPAPQPAAGSPTNEEQPAQPAQPPEVKTVSPTKQWSGEVGDPAPAKVAPKSLVLTNRADFEKVWKAWWRFGETPEVDFTTSFVAVVTWTPGERLLQNVASERPVRGTDGVKITALKVLPDGSAHLVMSLDVSDDPGEKWVETKGFYWGLSVFPRAGITSVNGIPLPP